MSKLKILFVDNSKTTRVTMSRLLEKRGYTVEVAGTGMEAISMAENNKFDLVIMDLYMPMMNGYEAARRIRELESPEHANTPIVALTASNDESDVQISKDAGMDKFVTKSDDHIALFKVLEEFEQKLNN